MALLVRLKPLNAKKGVVVKIYMFEGTRFYVERGWYEVADAFAERLRPLRQDHYDQDSPALFEIMTHEEAEQLEQREIEREESLRASARRPAIPLSTRAGREQGRRVQIRKRPEEESAGEEPGELDEEEEQDEDATDAEASESGDLTAAEVRTGRVPPKPQKMIDPDPEGSELDEVDPRAQRVVEVGRVAGKRSSPPPAKAAASAKGASSARAGASSRPSQGPRARSRKKR